MLPPCHLFEMGHTGREVPNANTFMLSLVARVEDVVTSEFLAPLEDVVEKELVAYMKDFADKEESRITEPPVLPEWKMYSK
jgi:hypothetical protein